MTTIAEIKAAIEKLSPSERAEVERLLHGETDDDWDRQMMSDGAAGKLDSLIAQVDKNIEAGNLREIP